MFSHCFESFASCPVCKEFLLKYLVSALCKSFTDANRKDTKSPKRTDNKIPVPFMSNICLLTVTCIYRVYTYMKTMKGAGITVI